MSHMMVIAHPNMSKSQADAHSSGSANWLKFRIGDEEISLHGDARHAEAFRKIAEIFNDAFMPLADNMRALSDFDDTGLDIPYAPEPA